MFRKCSTTSSCTHWCVGWKQNEAGLCAWSKSWGFFGETSANTGLQTWTSKEYSSCQSFDQAAPHSVRHWVGSLTERWKPMCSFGSILLYLYTIYLTFLGWLVEEWWCCILSSVSGIIVLLYLVHPWKIASVYSTRVGVFSIMWLSTYCRGGHLNYPQIGFIYDCLVGVAWHHTVRFIVASFTRTQLQLSCFARVNNFHVLPFFAQWRPLWGSSSVRLAYAVF